MQGMGIVPHLRTRSQPPPTPSVAEFLLACPPLDSAGVPFLHLLMIHQILYPPGLPSSNPVLPRSRMAWAWLDVGDGARIRVLPPDRRGRSSARLCGGTDQFSEIFVVERGPTGNRQ